MTALALVTQYILHVVIQYVMEVKTVQLVHLIVVNVETVEMDHVKIPLEKIVIIALKIVELVQFHDVAMVIVIYTLMKDV
jgi:hypothetical protein